MGRSKARKWPLHYECWPCPDGVRTSECQSRGVLLYRVEQGRQPATVLGFGLLIWSECGVDDGPLLTSEAEARAALHAALSRLQQPGAYSPGDAEMKNLWFSYCDSIGTPRHWPVCALALGFPIGVSIGDMALEAEARSVYPDVTRRPAREDGGGPLTRHGPRSRR
jgi:hypothetical protein